MEAELFDVPDLFPPEEAVPDFSAGASAKALEDLEALASLRGISAGGDRAYKIWKEFDRLRGLLRFREDGEGRYIARCAPDHPVLPLLADHFFRRFGETPWAIIDEKRGFALVRERDRPPELLRIQAAAAGGGPRRGNAEGGGSAGDGWEELWRNYHRSVNNEGRANPELQRRFMPKRYWKYLPELDRQADGADEGSPPE
ncbi:MAG: TIGR03915 family putative DNA repair protein [Treponema sp.]|jgi:probable DNA metabolism protein|nr:TIGR03915 family putative DNA repair protein [Treponema sp.]